MIHKSTASSQHCRRGCADWSNGLCRSLPVVRPQGRGNGKRTAKISNGKSLVGSDCDWHCITRLRRKQSDETLVAPLEVCAPCAFLAKQGRQSLVKPAIQPKFCTLTNSCTASYQWPACRRADIPGSEACGPAFLSGANPNAALRFAESQWRMASW